MAKKNRFIIDQLATNAEKVLKDKAVNVNGNQQTFDKMMLSKGFTA